MEVEERGRDQRMVWCVCSCLAVQVGRAGGCGSSSVRDSSVVVSGPDGRGWHWVGAEATGGFDLGDNAFGVGFRDLPKLRLAVVVGEVLRVT